ncbi:MAG: hypothetical protein KGH71_03120 [Candidatus Micrarchaeota archaeon]|nr:hypothetical protein [Candidatus Micrarchaeota archaeon]
MVTQIKTVGEEKQAIDNIANKVAKILPDAKDPIAVLRDISDTGLRNVLIERGGDESTISKVKVETMKKLFTGEQTTPSETPVSTGK